MSRFVDFIWHDAVYRLSSSGARAGREEIVRQRELLEAYLRIDRDFARSFTPMVARPDAPEIAREMAAAAKITGVGPMAAVAGAIAQRAASAMIALGSEEAIVDNGGDLFIDASRSVIVGLFAGPARGPANSPAPGSDALPGLESLGLRLVQSLLPCSVCSSSARMGHSVSLGSADLATVVASSGALADAAATALCNAATSPGQAEAAVESVLGYPGVLGALVVIEGRLIAAGTGIDLVKHSDPEVRGKITAHPRNTLFSGRG